MDKKTLFVLGLVLLSIGVTFFELAEPEHEYEVHTQNVPTNSSYSQANVTDISSFSKSQQTLIYESMEEGSFFKGTTYYEKTTEEINTTDEWHLVEIKSIPVFITIEHTGTIQDITFQGAVSFIPLIIGAGLVLKSGFYISLKYIELK